MARKDDFYDDGRTVADMSGLDGGTFIGRLRRVRSERRAQAGKENFPSGGAQPYGQAENDRKTRRYYTLGAVGAGLLIGAVYLVAFAALILLMLFIFGKL